MATSSIKPTCRLDEASSDGLGRTSLKPVSGHVGSQAGVSIFIVVSIAAIFALSRPFSGISGDGRVYIARALADLDPNGIGRDFMFVLDGQSQFTVFTFLADWLVARLDPSDAAMAFAVLALSVWFIAMSVLARSLAKGRLAGLILVFVAVLPAWYGPFHLLKFGEGMATPRPFAEAFVLAALAALLQRRLVLAFGLLACSGLFHPIMALPGFLFFFAVLCIHDRRWLWLAGAAGLAVIAFVALDAPFAHNVVGIIDADWLLLLRIRNPYLFPTQWPFEAYGPIAVAMITLLIAADLAAPRMRFVFLGAAGVGLAGLLIATMFGDAMPIIVVVQAQTWRWLWLTGVIGAAALAMCAFALWKNGATARLTLASLALGWMCWDEPLLACIAAAAAAIFRLWGKFRPPAIRPGMAAALFVVIISCGLVWRGLAAGALIGFFGTRPQAIVRFELIWDIYVLSIPIAIGAVAWALGKMRIGHVTAALVSAGAVGALVLFWDDRGPAVRQIEANRHPPDLVAMTADRPGEVLWIDSDETWFRLGRANWSAHIQGAGIVFSRPLAMRWHERTQVLIDHGLADATVLAPWKMQQGITRIGRANVAPFCARADAPAWIIAPLERGAPPPDLPHEIWHPPVNPFKLIEGEDGPSWHEIDRYAIIACAR